MKILILNNNKTNTELINYKKSLKKYGYEYTYNYTHIDDEEIILISNEYNIFANLSIDHFKEQLKKYNLETNVITFLKTNILSFCIGKKKLIFPILNINNVLNIKDNHIISTINKIDQVNIFTNSCFIFIPNNKVDFYKRYDDIGNRILKDEYFSISLSRKYNEIILKENNIIYFIFFLIIVVIIIILFII